jgi:hypothetical protein
VAVRDALLVRGWTLDVDLTYVFEPDAPHSETAWRARAPTFLRALFPR